MSKKEKALKLALEFAEEHARHWTGFGRSGKDVIAAIKQALAEQENNDIVVTYQEAFETMQSLYNGNSKQQSIAHEFGKTKLYANQIYKNNIT